MFTKDITIFNKKFDSTTRTDKYYRNVVNGCFVDGIENVATSKNGLNDSDSIFIAIPFANTPNYIEPKDYIMSTDITKYTFQKGDIVIMGNIVKDYQTIKDMQLQHDVFTIIKIDKKDFGSMPHFEISGK